MKTLSKITFLLVLTLFSSCATTSKITALKPEPDDASPLVYENTPSFINIPIAIKLKDIENQTNKFMMGLIFEDNKIEDICPFSNSTSSFITKSYSIRPVLICPWVKIEVNANTKNTFS